MLAMIRTAPPHAWQVSMSMPKTRFRRCAQVLSAVAHESECLASVYSVEKLEIQRRLNFSQNTFFPKVRFNYYV
jgi:hypothetical protein